MARRDSVPWWKCPNDPPCPHGGLLHDGLEVPVDKDHNGWWLVSKHQYETAVRRAEQAVKEAG
jgi:hypothetical protein